MMTTTIISQSSMTTTIVYQSSKSMTMYSFVMLNLIWFKALLFKRLIIYNILICLIFFSNYFDSTKWSTLTLILLCIFMSHAFNFSLFLLVNFFEFVCLIDFLKKKRKKFEFKMTFCREKSMSISHFFL